MKLFVLVSCLAGLIPQAYGQSEKDFAISFSAGSLTSPEYDNAAGGRFFSFGFDYHVSKRHVISINYLIGGHDYFDDKLSNAPASIFIIYPGKTNAEAEYNTFSVLYKYKILNGPKLAISPGVGAGIITHSRNYPVIRSTSLLFETSSWSDLAIPVTLDINYKLSKHWQLGLAGGLLIHGDYPVMALYGGPRLSYVLK